MKKHKVKKEILETLEHNPIVESACKKHGISRQTFYRWQEEDPEFRRKAESAISLSHESITDMAESQLFKKITEGNMTAIRIRLTTHSERYRPKAYRKDPPKEDVNAKDDASFKELINRPVDISNMDPKLIERIRKRREEQAESNSSQ